MKRISKFQKIIICEIFIIIPFSLFLLFVGIKQTAIENIKVYTNILKYNPGLDEQLKEKLISDIENSKAVISDKTLIELGVQSY